MVLICATSGKSDTFFKVINVDANSSPSASVLFK